MYIHIHIITITPTYPGIRTSVQSSDKIKQAVTQYRTCATSISIKTSSLIAHIEFNPTTPLRTPCALLKKDKYSQYNAKAPAFGTQQAGSLKPSQTTKTGSETD